MAGKKQTREKKGKKPPVKITLNLYVKEKKPLRPTRLIPGVLAVLLLAALFGKFAVLDRYAAVKAAQEKLAAEQAELDAIRETYADYDEVLAEYREYNYTGFDRTIADRLDILAILERKVFPMGDVERVSITGKTVSMTVTGLSLRQVSGLLKRLEAEPLVSQVTVSTAGYGETPEDETKGAVPVANMTIELADADSPEGGED